ncbi:ABC transporter substrate-binding protein [Paenibacillus xylaniclasticus]|uniref:ABC transporter substrate-binding protein n=1 Tax=Paenibacillus xylaniclasticus TaxID=588083 RepID=UPI000FD8670C|nr:MULTISPECIES: ABC transporter substrate-binding protein [Paenibacillus]GFN31425.1 hypothetical protein PCURB6_16850 [Paenibacillus curdlanolyticus]
MKFLTKAAAAALLSLAVLIAGCSSEKKETTSATTVDETSGQASANQEQSYKLKVGYGQGFGSQLGFLAEYKGYFKEQNLEVEFVPFAVTADGLNALQTDKIDIGVSFGTAGPLTFISKGSEFSIIGGHLSGGTAIFAREEDKEQYKTIEGYRGKRIGTVRLYTGDIVLRTALSAAGIDWKKDVELTEFKSPSVLLEAIKSGKVDVGVGGINRAAAAEAGVIPVTWTNDLLPDGVCCRIVANTDEVNDKSEAYKRFLKAIIKAEKIRFSDPEETVTASRPYLNNLDDATIRDMVIEEHQWNYSDPNKKAIEEMWDSMVSIGYITDGKDTDIDQHINTTLYKQAVEELIEENPDDEFFKQVQERFIKQNT